MSITRIGKIGITDAKLNTTIRAIVQAEIASALGQPQQPTQYGTETLTAYFYNGAMKGEGAGLIASSGGDFAEFNAALPQFMLDFFEDDEFSDVAVPLKTKSGEDVLDSNGDPINEYYVKFYNHQYRHGKGTTSDGIEYEYMSIAKYGETPEGYHNNVAFAKASTLSAWKDYILIAKYPYSKVTDGNGNTYFGSFKNGTPIAEIGVPETYIHPKRGGGVRGMRTELLYVAMLSAIIYGDRGMGYQSSASKEISEHFLGNALEVATGGTQLSDARGNTNASGNTFSLLLTDARAALQVGATVCFHDNNNFYAGFGGNSGNNPPNRTITARLEGETYVTFTFDGDAINVYGKYLYCNYFGKTGLTDNGVGAISGVPKNAGNDIYPVGYAPFKLLGIENPFGMYATWLDWCKGAVNGQLKFYLAEAEASLDAGSWETKSVSGITNDTFVRSCTDNVGLGLLMPGSGTADAATGYGFKSKWANADNYCVFYGRDNGDNYKHGSLFSFCSCVNYGWSYVAGGGAYGGCWGRVFRGVR